MSSISSVSNISSIELDSQNRRGKYTLTWLIHKFSEKALKKDRCLTSVNFEVAFFKDAKWWLELYPKGYDDEGFVCCGLVSKYGKSTPNVILSIRDSNGQFIMGEDVLLKDRPWMKLVKFEQKDIKRYLVNDILTLRCYMWKDKVKVPLAINWEVHSRVTQHSKLDFTWVLDDISASIKAFEGKFIKIYDVTEFFIDKKKVELQLFTKGSSCDGFIHFGLRIVGPQHEDSARTTEVHLIDANGEIVHSSRGEHSFKVSDADTLKSFPLISVSELCENKDLYLPRNKLTLRCKLWGNATINRVETFFYGPTQESQPKPSATNQQAWSNKMQRCYMEGKYCDGVIRTPNGQFTINRSILGIHSEVFDAIFERCIKEQKAAVIDIRDLDEDTIPWMLKYMYTGTLPDNMDCSVLQELYLAAITYRIQALQEKCSISLMQCLDVSNVCDILELADAHSDHELKVRARDFIHVHAQEIIVSKSVAWKNLKQNKPHLTTEILEWMYCKD